MNDAALPTDFPSPHLPRKELSSTLFYAGCVLLVVIQLGMALNHIREIPLLEPDEPRYASAGRTMAEGGSWMIPEYNGQPRINKPPFFYWLVASSVLLCGGSDELSSRFPSILMGLLMLGTTLFLAAKVFDRRTALVSGAILLTFPLYIALSRTCITDMTLSALLSAAMAMWMLLMLGKISRSTALWAGTFFFGLAVLTKATAAFCILLPVLIERALRLKSSHRPRLFRWMPYLLAAALVLSAISEHIQDQAFSRAAQALLGCVLALIVLGAFKAGAGALKGRIWPSVLCVAFAMGAWWYAALTYQLGWVRFQELLSFEVGGRLAGQVHREGLYFYPLMLLAITFPWSMGLPSAVASAWSGSTPVEGNQESSENSEKSADRFLLAWLFGIILFYSIPGAKLVTYLMPALPAAAILLARYILQLSDRNGAGLTRAVFWKKLNLLPAVLLIGGVLVTALWPELLRHQQAFLNPLQGVVWMLLLLACLGFGVGWILAVRGSWRVAVVLLAGSTLAALLLFFPALLPGLESRSARKLCLKVKDRLADVIANGRIVSVGSKIESLPYYLHTTIREAKLEAEPRISVVLEELARPEKVALFIHRRYYARMLGLDKKTFSAYSQVQIKQTLPLNSEFVDMDDDLIIVRNLR